MTATRARSPAAPEPDLVARFAEALSRLWPEDGRLGLAVSGGPDSLALLLLAEATIPGRFEVATVDHGLRAASAEECAMVAQVCAEREIPCSTLAVTLASGNVQSEARKARYAALAAWAEQRVLSAVATAHHADDQAETLLMRLNRGSGLSGLTGVRESRFMPRSAVSVIRPLLTCRRHELGALVAAAGIEPVQDPSNEDEQFERVRVRKALAQADWLNPDAIAQSAGHLAEADGALHWATDLEWARAVTSSDAEIVYRPTDAPREIRRRIIRRSLLKFATEGGGVEPRGRELDQILTALAGGKRATLRGVLCVGGREWRFSRAPARREAPQSAHMGAVEG